MLARVLRAFAATVAALLIAGAGAVPAAAATQNLTIRALTDSVLPGKTFTLFGSTTPAAKGAVVTRQVYRDKTWKTTGTTITNGRGDWKMVVTAPAWKETLKLRVQATLKGRLVTSAVVVVQVGAKPVPKPTPTQTPVVDEGPVYEEPLGLPVDIPSPEPLPEPVPSIAPIDALGKGNRILGSDIARYQHPVSVLFPDGAPIDFTQMYRGGVRFLYIKASDGRDLGHANAEKWFAKDRADAQAAGIYTGFYHYAYFPASTIAADIIADARAQADKAIWRLAAVGGYGLLDLPFALDIEESCVVDGSNGKCARSVTKNAATLWVKSWLARMIEKTGRKPVVYSSPSFLQNYLNRDAVLRDYPLWIAHYDRDPSLPANFPGMKSDGTCFIHAWTLNNCASRWAIWQYTSSGKATNFGIAGGNLDLNLYSGSTAEFLQFANGIWTPGPDDFLPFNEPTTVVVSNPLFSTTTNPLTADVAVFRPSGAPVVSGGVGFTLVSAADGSLPTPEQLAAVKTSSTRTGVGSWTVRVTGLPAGTWVGAFTFTDPSKVHAPSSGPLTFTLAAPAAPTEPTPEPTPTPTPTTAS